MSIKMCVSFFTYLSPGSHEPGRLIERWWGPKPKRETETHQALYSGWKAVCLLCHSLSSSVCLIQLILPFFLPPRQHLQLKQTLFSPAQPWYPNKENQQQTVIAYIWHDNNLSQWKEALWYVSWKWILFSLWLQSSHSQELRLTKAPTRELERKMDEVAPRHSYQVSMCFIP